VPEQSLAVVFRRSDCVLAISVFGSLFALSAICPPFWFRRMVITRSGRGTMKREEMDKLTLDQLHAELAKYNMPVNPDRAVCIDTLMSF